MVDGLIFPSRLREQLLRLAREGDPDEVCGMLGGRDLQVVDVLPVRNIADEVSADQAVFRDRESGVSTGGLRPVHYYMDSRDQLRAYNELDARGLAVVGYYHSHTHTEARPSPTDIRLATDLAAAYVLVSLTHAPNVRAWRITKRDPSDETGELNEVAVDFPPG